MCLWYTNVTMEAMDSSKQNSEGKGVEKSALFLCFITHTSTSSQDIALYTNACGSEVSKWKAILK